MYSRQLESFIETAHAGSFSKAARALYIAPSSLIQQIDLLEQRLGVVLFERGRKGVTLTEAGESLYADAVEIVRHSNEAVARARQIQNGEGPLRVATSLLMKCRLLPTIWSHMIEEVPNTHIDIISLESAGVEPGNYLYGLGSSYDVMEGLYMSELYRDRCTFLELTRSPLCVTLPKALADSCGGKLSAELLSELDIVMMKPGVSAEYDAARSTSYENLLPYISERSISENLLALFFGIFSIRKAGESLSLRYSMTPETELNQVAAMQLDNSLPRFAENHGLTKRESEILRLLLEGKDNQNIASAMGVSMGTVKAHLNHIYGKVGIKTRQELKERFWSE